MLWTLDSQVPEIISNQVNGTISMVLVFSIAIDLDRFSQFVIFCIMTLRLGQTTSSMIQTPDNRSPRIFLSRVNGARSTVLIFPCANSLEHFTVSSFTTWADSALHDSDSQWPNSQNFLTTVQWDSINGPDLLWYQWSRSNLAFRDFTCHDFMTLEHRCFHALDSR